MTSDSILPTFDDGPAFGFQVLGGFHRAINQAPEVSFEQLAHVLDRYLFQLAMDRSAGVVNPRIVAAEALLSRLGNALHIGRLADISSHINSLTTSVINSITELARGISAARGQYQLCAGFGRQTGRNEADSRRCTGNDDDLFAEVFEVDFYSNECS